MARRGLRRLARPNLSPLTLGERFGLRSLDQVTDDLSEVVREGLRGTRFQFGVRSLAMLRPMLSLPAYAGLVARDGLAPVFNLFDRVGGGMRYTQRVSRSWCRDYRGGRLSYDEHDGTDMVCPVGTPLCAAAPGIVVMIRHRWLRGGLTVAVDHGHGVITQYTHCSRALVEVGQFVRRGEPVSLSGASGYDLVQFFPWLAPHIHFAVFVGGRPRDPFLARGEAPRAGSWMHANQPRTSGPEAGDASRVVPSEVDPAALDEVADGCTDAAIRGEIARVVDDRPSLASLLEDALCHDSWAFPARLRQVSVRPCDAPIADLGAVALTLPLPASDFRGIRLADTPWSAPPR